MLGNAEQMLGFLTICQHFSIFQDCFSISTLHLLAQTDVGRDLRPLNEHLECTFGSCLISNFMSEYVEGKKTQLDPNAIVQNYSGNKITKA